MSRILFRLLLDDLLQSYKAMFGQSAMAYWQSFDQLAEEVLLLINTTDAPYHNLDHTLQVLGVGQAILEGRQQQCHDLTPQDWLNSMVALLCHDVGYLRGICHGDDWAHHRFQTGQEGGWVQICPQATDASLTPYHVDRSQQFVRQRLSDHPLIEVEAVISGIELTRFPVPAGAEYRDTAGLPGLGRAADLIGQLSDLDYLKKLPALFCEFEEIGTNAAMGYVSVTDLRASYPEFYWHIVYPFIQPALRYLAITASGRQVIARLFTNVYLVELEQSLPDSTSSLLRQQVAQHQLLPYQPQPIHNIWRRNDAIDET